jgi:type IV secretory pathway VirB2 component (pilin)
VPADDLAGGARTGDRPGRRAGGRLARLSARRLSARRLSARRLSARRLRARRLRGPAGRWLSIFGASLALFIVRFLVPGPVGQADNRDGPRLMCGRGLGLGPVVPRGDPRFFRYAYFAYAPSPDCAHTRTYPSSEVAPLELARLLTPVFRLPGTLNLIALGLLMCVLASIGIASLVTGLRLRPWAQALLAAGIWLIMADATFFDVYASPFSDPAALIGLLLVAAGVVYLGRGWRPTLRGLALAGPGGLLAILSKEQYLILAVPVCLTLVLASADRGRAGGGWRGWAGRLGTRQTGAAGTVAALIAVTAAGYWLWDSTSRFAAHLHHEQAVNMIFEDIVNGHDNAAADLRALGLPASWAKYAGDYYWKRVSARNDPLFARYEARLTDGTIAGFLLTHPRRMASIGQQAAVFAQQYQLTSLGDYPPSAARPPGAVDARVAVVTWLVHRLPRGLGLLWLLPLWTAMAAVAAMTLSRRRGEPWHRDAAAAAACMTGCAIVAFVPPAFFDGISTTRHMVGMNLATALAFAISVALAASMIRRGVTRRRPRPQAPAKPAEPELARPGG